MNNWFEVDTAGLKALQSNKPKTFIINELVQNAWDEDIALCSIRFKYNKDNSLLTITVKDDSPEGFKNITHAYTLFADTYKRSDPTKRGRFNLGENKSLQSAKLPKLQQLKEQSYLIRKVEKKYLK